jgi:hypothetical protein
MPAEDEKKKKLDKIIASQSKNSEAKLNAIYKCLKDSKKCPTKKVDPNGGMVDDMVDTKDGCGSN